jgi:hypothetical protein
VPAEIVLKKGLNRKEIRLESTEDLAGTGKNYTALETSSPFSLVDGLTF